MTICVMRRSKADLIVMWNVFYAHNQTVLFFSRELVFEQKNRAVCSSWKFTSDSDYSKSIPIPAKHTLNLQPAWVLLLIYASLYDSVPIFWDTMPQSSNYQSVHWVSENLIYAPYQLILDDITKWSWAVKLKLCKLYVLLKFTCIGNVKVAM